MKLLVILLPSLLLFLPAISPARTGNPYCVSGANWASGGVMQKLGMPSESWAYSWNSLEDTNVPNMVRPCSYLARAGVNPPHYKWGYHETDNTIDDPTYFGAWLDAHPGKIWIIGNEPDLTGQDGLTQEQYARMFKTYYDFIRAHDPTARFAIGAVSGLNEISHTYTITNTEAWYQGAMNSYKAQFGAIMPVDIWNFHFYAGPDHSDAQVLMNEWVLPFCNWVKTIEGGAYSNCEIWLTEFGIGGPLNIENVNIYMYDLCRMLESSPLDRWFWFLGPYDRDYADVCLLNFASAPTLLGRTYATLARGYPNGPYTVPPKPALPDPPRVFKDDFNDGDLAGWSVKAGAWLMDNKTLRQININPHWWGDSVYLSYLWTDGAFAVNVKINGAADAKNWAGFLVRAHGPWDSASNSGYLIYLRQNGELGVYTGADGQVVAVPGAATDMSVFHRLAAKIVKYTIKVYVDGALKATWTDPNKRFSHGYFALQAGKTDCSFDNLRIERFDVRYL